MSEYAVKISRLPCSVRALRYVANFKNVKITNSAVNEQFLRINNINYTLFVHDLSSLIKSSQYVFNMSICTCSQSLSPLVDAIQKLKSRIFLKDKICKFVSYVENNYETDSLIIASSTKPEVHNIFCQNPPMEGCCQLSYVLNKLINQSMMRKRQMDTNIRISRRKE